MPWFESTMYQGETYYTDIELSVVTGLPDVAFSAPVLSDDGEILGASLIPVQTPYVVEVLQGTRESETRDAYLIDREGYLLTEARFWEEAREGAEEETFYSAYQIDTPATQDVLAGQTESGIYQSYHGEEVLETYIPVAEDWGLILEYQTFEVWDR